MQEPAAASAGRVTDSSSGIGLGIAEALASPGKAAHVTGWHGRLGLTKSAAPETAEHGMAVDAICPVIVWTPLVERKITGAALPVDGGWTAQ